MALTEEQKRKIEEEEEYRAKLRSKKSGSEKKKTHPVTGCLAGCILVFLVILGGIGFLVGDSSTETPQDPSATIGKHAYNRISGAYQGEILEVKPCNTTSEVTCYVVNQPTFMRPIEVPVDNSVVRDEAPTPTASPQD